MTVLPPVPPVPDLDRYAIYTLAQDTLTITVNFPVYGEQEDIAVTVNGVELGLESWQLVSASGTPTSQLPRPITDGQVMFSPVIPSGSVVEIIGSFQPRQTSMPTAPGLARREFNQVTGGLWSTLREIKRQLGKTAAPVAMHADASGTLGNRSNYDGAAAGFVYLQTDDTAMRPIFYVKNSASAGDWSQALIVQSQSVSGFPVLARANVIEGPIVLTGTLAPTVMISNLVTFASGVFSTPRSVKVRMLGSWIGNPSIAVGAGTVTTLGTLTPPVNAGAAQNLEAEWNIDALTTTHQVSNNDLRCTTTPYLVAQRRLSTAANFAPATPVSLTLSAQLADVSHNLTIDRCEVITI